MTIQNNNKPIILKMIPNLNKEHQKRILIKYSPVVKKGLRKVISHLYIMLLRRNKDFLKNH